MSPRLPSGRTLAELKKELVGKSVVVGTTTAEWLHHPPRLTTRYEIRNVTRDAVIVAFRREPSMPHIPVTYSANVSIRVVTGASQWRFPRDVVHVLHPQDLARIRALYGAAEQAGEVQP